ncbi:MAG TPA: hypothetical protein VKT82_19285 [Ktedonobacterales bacterium]|nr:hypothetical protein [Ktedonobacterales bacterium]
MSEYRQRSSFRAAQTSESEIGWMTLPGRLALAMLIALSLLAVGAIAVPFRVHASGGAQVVITAPIYPGQNNGNAEGPVGATVSVQGSGWAVTSADVQVTLADEQNDTSGQPGSACQNGGPQVSIAGLSQQQPDGSGNFTVSFVWPAAAAATGHAYWVCGQQGGTTSPGVSAFTVLSSNPPSLQVSDDSQAFPGGTIKVSGQNWLPGNQPITVVVTPCLNCDPGYTSTATVNSAADGSLNVTVNVPTQAKIGNQLFVTAANASSDPSLPPALNVNDSSNAPRFTVTSQATPTPTPTPSPTPTVGVTATATSTPAAGGSVNTTNTSSSNTILVILLAAVGVVLLIAAGIAVALFLRSRGPTPDGPVKGGPPYGDGPGYGPPRGQYSSGPRRTGPSYDQPSYPDTNAEYYGAPPPRSGPPGQGWRNAGGWQGNPQGPEPDDGSGDDPTIGMRTPWR